MRLLELKIDGFRHRYTLSLDCSSITYIIGRNGTGKTTLVKLLNSCLRMDVRTLETFEFRQVRMIFQGTERTGNTDLFTLLISRQEEITGEFSIEIQGLDVEPVIVASSFLKAQILQQSDPSSSEAYSIWSTYFPTGRLDKRKLSGRSVDLWSAFTLDKNSIAAASKILSFTNKIKSRWLPLERALNVSSSTSKSVGNVDQKVEEVQNGLVRYFSELDKLTATEFENFRNSALLSLFKVEGTASGRSRAPTKAKIERLSEEIDELIQQLNLTHDLEKEFRRSAGRLIGALSTQSRGRPLEALRQASARLDDIVNLWRNTQINISKIYERRDAYISFMRSAFALDDLPEADRQKFMKEPILRENNELAFSNPDPESNGLLRVQDLSSGEKQFFIMLSEALLERNEEVILIIDEPELSLHISWQQRLVSDIVRLNPHVQLILATHSPDIIQTDRQNVFRMESGLKIA